MARWLIPLALMLVMGCGQEKTTPAPAKGPVPRFESELVDIGLFHSEGEKQVEFPFRNEGDGVLLIERVDSSCGCAKPLFPQALQPGENGTITVGYAPEPVDQGPRVETVKVFTNAREAPYELQFTIDLHPLLRLAPGSPLVVPIEPGGVATQMVMLTPRRGAGVLVESFESKDPRVTLERVVMPDDSYAAKMTIRSRGAGDFIAPLTIQATHPRLGNVLYQVGAEARSGPVSQPPVLRVPALAATGAKKLLPPLTIFARDGAVRVESARAVDSALEVTSTEVNAEGRTEIRLSYRGGWKVGVKRTELVVETNHSKHPTLRVPIEVTITPG